MLAERKKQSDMGEIDSHVGKRIRSRRTELGKTQQKLAEDVGLTFQQIQKYESGQNRVAAPFLWTIANALEVTVDFFFAGLDDAVQHTAESEHIPIDDHLVIGSQSLRLVRCFRGLDPTQRSAILGLVISMSGGDDALNSESGFD